MQTDLKVQIGLLVPYDCLERKVSATYRRGSFEKKF
jgi:hypothetical protein